MVFKRIDDENVNCIINENDMQEFDVKIDDFLKNSGKAHDFLKSIVSRAVEEVDFRAADRVLSIKMMMLPDNRISIILSENPETNLNNMYEQIKDFAQSELNGEDKDDDMFDDGNVDELSFEDSDFLSRCDMESTNLEEFLSDFFKTTRGVEAQDTKKKKKTVPSSTIKVFVFDSLSEVEKFCYDIPKKIYVKSSLYKDETQDKFYFLMEKSHISTNKFNKLCDQINEFACSEIGNRNFNLYLKEHCKLIIENKAAKILKRTAAIV